MEERDVAVMLPLFDGAGGGMPGLPTDLDHNSLLGKIAEYQDAFKSLVATGYFTDTEVNEFLKFCTDLVPPAGEHNIFARGLGVNDWRKDESDPVHVYHMNDFQTCGNLLLRLQANADNFSGDGAQWIGHPGFADPVWATARAGGFAGQNGLASNCLWTPWFGRHAEEMVPPDGYQVTAETYKEAKVDFDTSCLAGYTITDAWVLVEKMPLATWGASARQTHFNFKIQVGGNDARSLASSTAADIAGFLFMGSGTADVWKADVTPAWINQGGTTTVRLVYTDNPLADDATWDVPGGDGHYFNCFAYSGGASPARCTLIVELQFEYRP